MALVIRMKYVTRFLLFMASLIVWLLILFLLNNTVFNVDETLLLAVAIMVGFAQMWGLAALLHS